MMYEINGKLQEISINISNFRNYSSVHGFIRTMERADKNGYQALNFIKNAWLRGKSAIQFQQKKQKNYLARFNSLLFDGYTNLKVYCGYLFIFSASGRLITMHALPKSFNKKPVYDGKTKVRDIRKYHRFKKVEDYAEDYEFSA